MSSTTRLADLLDTTHDVNAYEGLLRVLNARNSLALVGAGFSQRVGYPSWDKLLDQMSERVIKECETHASFGMGPAKPLTESLKRHEDFLWRAEELRRRLDDVAYDDFLKTTFASTSSADNCLDMLVRMPFRHLLTTNYDDSLEVAYRRVHGKDIAVTVWDDGTKVRELMYDLLQSDCPQRLVYLHGKIGEEVKVVLTDRDYAERYLRNDSTVRKLFAIFAMHRLVLFGFSLRDPDLSAIMRQVAGALGYDQARHFAFVGLHLGDGDRVGDEREIERRRFRQKFGVDAIFYDDANRHARLEVLMAHMIKHCEQPTRILESALAAAPTAAPQSFGDQILSDDVGISTVERAIAPEKRRTRSNPRIPDDHRKGMFGGRADDPSRGRRLRATVRSSGDSKTLFAVHLEVVSEPGSAPLTGDVTFYLHDTFQPPEVQVPAANGIASLDLVAYGAFTVGATGSDGMELELDLTTIDAPARFLAN